MPGGVGVGPLDAALDDHAGQVRNEGPGQPAAQPPSAPVPASAGAGAGAGIRAGAGASAAERAHSRSSPRWSFPLPVRGSRVTNSTARGYLYGAMAPLTWACSSRAVASSAGTPAPSTTYALTSMPRRSSGAPTTPHSSTYGWATRAFSTSGPAML